MRVIAISLLFLIIGTAMTNCGNDSLSYQGKENLFVDLLTGCEYSGNSVESIMPSLDGNGNHIGCKG